MTIAYSLAVSGPYVADGVNTVWPFTFKAVNAAHLRLNIENTTTGVITQVTSGFTVSGLNTDAGGEVSYAVAAGNTVTVERAVPYTQPNRIGNQGAFLPEVHERTMDLLEMQLQQILRLALSNISKPVTDPAGLDMTLPSAAIRAGKFLSFDEDGSPVVGGLDSYVESAQDAEESATIALLAVAAALEYAQAAAASAAAAAAAAGFNPSDYLTKAANLAGLANLVTARANLGLHAVASSGSYADLSGLPSFGNGAFKNTGTGSNTLAAGDDSRFADIATKAPLASPPLTGNPTAPTQSPGTNNTRLATTAYADASAAAAAAALGTPTAFNAIGTDIFAQFAPLVQVALASGATTAASNLIPAYFYQDDSAVLVVGSSAETLSGTWRNMGADLPGALGGDDPGYRISLFRRVA